MLHNLTLQHFRCFARLEVEFREGATVIIGGNAQGKTSLLEACCVLLRLQSPRVSALARAIQHERRGFALDGCFHRRHLQFYFGRERKKLVLDSVEQSRAAEYLQLARVVWFSNPDIEIVRGPGEHRRRFLDFVAMQIDPIYRGQLRAYERALRSRNFLLKASSPRWREIEAFDAPLVEAGNYVTSARRKLVGDFQLPVAEAQRGISGAAEELAVEYLSGSGEEFAAKLIASRAEDARLRQTSAGPHRDDLAFFLNGVSSEFASEGQQRSMALSLKLAQAALLTNHAREAPLLLLDDIFGELDPNRRNALLAHLPPDAQKLIATTNLAWMSSAIDASVLELSGGSILRSS